VETKNLDKVSLGGSLGSKQTPTFEVWWLNLGQMYLKVL